MRKSFNSTITLQKCLYFNVYLYTVWVFVEGFFLYMKINLLEHLMKYLSVAVFCLLVPLDFVRLYLGYYGNLSCRVPELAGFLMLTILMQIPMVSYFLYNHYLLSTPTEVTLHTMMFSMSVIEAVLGCLALKKALALAKSIYLQSKKST